MSDSDDILNNSGPASTAEPSMEEILASIRRILKEDESRGTTAEDPDDDDVLLLDASMIAAPADISTATELPVDTGLIAAHDAAPVTTYHEPLHFTSEPAIDTAAYEQPAQEQTAYEEQRPYDQPRSIFTPPQPAQHEEISMEEHVQSPNGLVGDEASASISNTIGSLVHSISNERAVAVTRGGLTIEDIVREEIRPVLKAWLDTNLPSLVERIVRAEIGRVIDRTQI